MSREGERLGPELVGLPARFDGSLELKSLSHEELSSHYCLDGLNEHEALFS